MRLLIILLALATAVIHFRFFISDPGGELIYGLNALGYVGLVILFYLPIPRLENLQRLIRWVLMGYTALTIVAYFAASLALREWSVPLGPVTKMIEILLIGLLWWQARQPATRHHI
jgi:hypothetical protein